MFSQGQTENSAGGEIVSSQGGRVEMEDLITDMKSNLINRFLKNARRGLNPLKVINHQPYKGRQTESCDL